VGTRDNAAVRRQVGTLFNVGTIRDLGDGQLLERFATAGGESAELAFAVLVERHGPMVLRVCRGVLGNADDSEDAFQATFLVLARKARTLWVRDSLGPWLHQVAFRTASCARMAAVRRRRHERSAAMLPKVSRPEASEELARAIHEEIARLAERERAPVVLCDLEGCTHEQAARHLGWPIGSVKSRLSRARERLRHRLLRRGLAPTTARYAAVLGPNSTDASITQRLVDATTSAVVRFVTDRTMARASAAVLAQGVLRSMAMTRWLKTASLVLSLGATASGVGLMAQIEKSGAEARPEAKPQGARPDELPVTEVRPGKLTVTVVDRGNLESSRPMSVYSKVEGTPQIIFIEPEGTFVKKGQLVCELDSADLRDRLINQQIATKRAEADWQNARLTREVAELTAAEYAEGTLKHEQARLSSAIAAAQSAIQKAEARLERIRRARKRLDEVAATKREAATAADIVAALDLEDRVDAAEQALLQEKTAIKLTEAKQGVLERFTRQKMTRELKLNVERARAEESVKEDIYRLATFQENKLEVQLKGCNLTAPDDGMLVYGNDPSQVDARPSIELGAKVRERQFVFSVPDLTRMRVNAGVREAWIAQVLSRQRVQIKVDAFPGVTLTGVVSQIAPMPDSRARNASGPKLHRTLIDIENPLRGLRPGMTAEVEILIKELDNVLSVPLSSVLELDGKYQVAVKKKGGGFEWREGTLGVSSDKLVEVKQGLQPGDRVIENPLALLSNQEQRERLGGQSKPAAKGKSPRSNP
jgi:RNA polymerase sigma factor (sigma-70 family)